MPDVSVDVLIVGAGPVGLTMAAALIHHGLTCRIIDKAAFPSEQSKALVVWSRTMELLDYLGLADTFVQNGMKVNGASIYGNGKRVVHVETRGVDSPFGFPLVIPQNETERLLAEHITGKGLVIERQVELTSFHEKENGIVATLRHVDGREEALFVPWLVSCDGAHSTVRHTLGIPFTGRAEPNDWMLADANIDGPLPPDEVSVFWHAKGVLVFFPINQTRFRMIADLGVADNDVRKTEPTLAEAQAKVDERGPGGLTLHNPVWLANFRINERKVSEYRHGRVMLAGDAAHIHSPAGGQGMNTGMQDAFNLAWKLALVHQGKAQAESLLNSYSQERSTVGDQVLHGAGIVTTIATLRNPVAQFLRNSVAGLLTSFGFVQDKIKNAICELSINYRQSPLSAQNWPRGAGGQLAGDRLGDAPLTSASSGRKATLLQVIRGHQHTLLALPGTHDKSNVLTLVEIIKHIQQTFPEAFTSHLIFESGNDVMMRDLTSDVSPLPVWLDVDGKARRQLGATQPTLVVVRPDGYIGYRSQPADESKLLEYFETYLIAQSALQSNEKTKTL